MASLPLPVTALHRQGSRPPTGRSQQHSSTMASSSPTPTPTLRPGVYPSPRTAASASASPPTPKPPTPFRTPQLPNPPTRPPLTSHPSHASSAKSRLQTLLTRVRAAISNPAPDEGVVYDSLGSQLYVSERWGGAVGMGAGGAEEREDADADAVYLRALANGGADGEEEPAHQKWKAKTYASSSDSIDEIVVDSAWLPASSDASMPSDSPNPNLNAAPAAPSPPTSPRPLKPPDPGRIAPLLWRFVVPPVQRFFDLSFWNTSHEDLFRRDSWFSSKHLAVTASLFYILNTILAIGLIPRPLSLMNKITYFGIAPLFTLPLPLFVLFNAPRFGWSARLQQVYQPLLLLATWCWSWFNIWDMWSCGYYDSVDHPACGNKDYLSTFYFAIALPVLAMFVLGQQRIFAALGAIAYTVLMCVLILPERASWVRNVVNFVAFQAFLIYVHYVREVADRRVFILREQLKMQFKVTEKAQELEHRASDSKKRFVSYIFHEVRVPLNTALLAVQNLAPDILNLRGQDDIELGALEGSLNMMSKVLNDVLDFNRMDSGRFESVNSPFCFHNVIRTMLIPLELAGEARGLAVTTELDPAIDEAANRAAFGAPTGREGWVLGDEMRLRQLVTNLTSNACKFTSAGGRICVKTMLVYPRAASEDGRSGVEVRRGDAGSGMSGTGGTSGVRPLDKDHIVVRIEVQDTGVGIRPRDIVANQLFSPYVQTEIGRFQGGKGTGLGLALVRHIVKLSGGRLGVKSKVGRGSLFWVELAFGVGKAAVVGLQEDGEYPAPGLGLGGNGTESERVAEVMRGKVEVEAERMNSALAMSLGIMPASAGLVDASIHEGATPSTTGSVMERPLLDTPLSDDSAMKTIMEHGGMFELTSRRSPLHFRSGEPSPTKQDINAPMHPPQPSRLPTPSEGPQSMEQIVHQANQGSLPTPDDSPDGSLGQASKSQTTAIMQHPGASGPYLSTGTLPPPPTPPAIAPDDPLPVLVVDDDTLTRKLMARMLTRLGCKVDVAENGQHALSMLLGSEVTAQVLAADPTYGGGVLPTPLSDENEQGLPPPVVHENKYGVVFLDNQMPFYSGVQVVYKLRELHRNTFVVGVTGNALKEDQQEYHDAGVDHILTKPVMEKDLRAMVALAREYRRKQFNSLSSLEAAPS